MKILIPALIFLMSGCSSYWEDRRNDLNDFIHADLELFSTGVKANIGPIGPGLYMHDFMHNKGIKYKLGLGGLETTGTEASHFLIIAAPIKENRVRSRWGYGEEYPHFGSIGVNLGIITGFAVRVDILEFFDLLLGFTGLDFMEDDTEEPELDKKPLND